MSSCKDEGDHVFEADGSIAAQQKNAMGVRHSKCRRDKPLQRRLLLVIWMSFYWQVIEYLRNGSRGH